MELCATEQIDPACAILIRFIVSTGPKLIEVVDFIEVADVVAYLSEEGHLQVTESLLPVLLQVQLDVHGLLEVRHHTQ